MEFISPLYPLSYYQPDFDLPESEKNEEWWIQNNRYIASQFNLPPIIWNDGDANINENLSPVDRGLRLSQYYIGKQTNYTYNHISEEVGWVKSKLVNKLVDTMAGQLIDMLNSKEISAKSLSKRAHNAKLRQWADLMLKYDDKYKHINDEMAKLGVVFTPKNADQFKDKEDVEKNFLLTVKDSLELYATDLAKGIEWQNDTDVILEQMFVNDFATSNYAGIYNYAENGKIKQKRVPFYNLIFDTQSDDPFVRDGKYCGIIERLTPAQLFKRFPNLNDKQREEIKELAKSETYYNNFTSFYNSPVLPCALKRNNNLLVTVCTTWWNGPVGLRKKLQTDKYGNKKIVNLKDGEQDSEYSIMDLHKSTVVANKMLLDWGYESNVVRSADKKSDPQMPIWVLNANTTLGDGVSVIGKVAPLIDDIDLYRKKLTDTVAKSKGKCYVFMGNKMDKSTREMITDFAVMGITTVIGTSGEVDDPNNNKRIVEQVDMTIDPNVTAYIQLRAALETEIENLLNMPKIAQGTQSSIIGMGVQQGTIAQASVGLTYMWSNFLKLNKLAMNHAVNMARILIASGKHDMSFMIGDRGEKMMKIIKDTMFEDVMIDLSIKDSVSEQERNTLVQIILAQAQQRIVSLEEGIAVLDAKTMTELRNEVKYFDKKREEAQAAQEEANAQREAAMVAQGNQTELHKKVIEQQGQDGRTENTNKANLEKAILNNATKEKIAKKE